MRHSGGICFLNENKYPVVKILVGKFVFLVFLYFVGHCNINFEEIHLYSMMLNPWLVLLRLYKTNIILQLIRVAVIKVCLETPFSENLYDIEIGQLI